MSDDDLMLVVTTAPSDTVAEALSRTLVGERLAACATRIAGAHSIYRWKGELHDDGEVVVLLKTTRARVEGLGRRLLEIHPYDCPELIAIPIEHALPAYASWLRAAVEP